MQRSFNENLAVKKSRKGLRHYLRYFLRDGRSFTVTKICFFALKLVKMSVPPARPAASQLAMPLLVVNMGGEMVMPARYRILYDITGLLQLYILEQRLQAQNIVDEKSSRGMHGTFGYHLPSSYSTPRRYFNDV